MQQQAIQIKDVILNIIKIKKQRDSLKRELDLMNAQIDQQVRFLEDSIIDEVLIGVTQQETPPKKNIEPSK